MDHFIFSSNRYGVLRFKLVQFVFFLKHVFYESSSAVSHLVETVVKTTLHRALTVACLRLLQILQVPDVVRYEFFHALNLNVVHKVFLEAVKRFDKSRYVLNKYVIACYHNLCICILVLILVLLGWVLLLEWLLEIGGMARSCGTVRFLDFE